MYLKPQFPDCCPAATAVFLQKKQQAMNTYQRIEKAINYMQAHFREQPDLDQIAEQAHLSAFHFQRLFTEWAGVSPKKFVQFLSVNYAKELLLNQRLSVSETAYETGLSGTSRLHDLFVSIEAMTPAEYRDGGQALRIRYQFADTLFGRVVVASTDKGVCTLQFIDDDAAGMVLLRQLWPNATLMGRNRCDAETGAAAAD